jgi:hypothetical protein
MRYLISAHGCYYKTEKVPLHNVRLEFHSSEDECVNYRFSYIKSFCSKSINKRNKAYKPVRKVDHQYYQMDLTRSNDDTSPCFIYCCSKQELLYDFDNGDLTLTNLIDMVRLHAEKHGHTGWIYISMLTCNTDCYDTSEEELTIPLRRLESFNNRRLVTTVIKNRRKRSLQTRKNNMRRLPYSSLKRKHIPKIGDRMIDKRGNEIEIQTKEESVQLRKNPKFVYLPKLQPGDYVMYEADLWVIDDIKQKHNGIIRNIKTNEIANVDIRDLIKTEF